MIDKSTFDTQIYPGGSKSLSDWKELFQYRNMIGQLVRRDFIVNYKQTVLGAFWAFIQPVVATLIMGMVFGNFAGLSPDGVPMFLFYLSGQFLWIFFSNCVNTTANVFIYNSELMRKVYFPRFVFPIDAAVSGMITLLIHIGTFTVIYIAYVLGGVAVRPNAGLLLIPLYVLQLTLLALGVGSILASLSTKYRDIAVMTSYGLLIWMYISPIVYDVNIVPEKYLWLYLLNPVSPIVINIRHGLFGLPGTSFGSYCFSLIVALTVFLIGSRMFHKAGRIFVDTN